MHNVFLLHNSVYFYLFLYNVLTTTVFIPLLYRIVKFVDPAAAQAAVETMNGIPSAPGLPGMKVRFDRK